MAKLLGQQYQSGRAKLEAELAKVEEAIRLATERRQSELRSAEAEVMHAQADEARTAQAGQPASGRSCRLWKPQFLS